MGRYWQRICCWWFGHDLGEVDKWFSDSRTRWGWRHCRRRGCANARYIYEKINARR